MKSSKGELKLDRHQCRSLKYFVKGIKEGILILFKLWTFGPQRIPLGSISRLYIQFRNHLGCGRQNFMAIKCIYNRYWSQVVHHYFSWPIVKWSRWETTTGGEYFILFFQLHGGDSQQLMRDHIDRHGKIYYWAGWPEGRSDGGGDRLSKQWLSMRAIIKVKPVIGWHSPPPRGTLWGGFYCPLKCK